MRGSLRFSAESGRDNQKQCEHGGSPVSILDFLGTSNPWFQSFQNDRSELLALASLVVLSIFFRQKDAPESEKVGAPYRATGTG